MNFLGIGVFSTGSELNELFNNGVRIQSAKIEEQPPLIENEESQIEDLEEEFPFPREDDGELLWESLYKKRKDIDSKSQNKEKDGKSEELKGKNFISKWYLRKKNGIKSGSWLRWKNKNIL